MGPARFHCATLLDEGRRKVSSSSRFLKADAIARHSSEMRHKKGLASRKLCSVRSGIRTHALRRGPRPERGALDHSAILTARTQPCLGEKRQFPGKKLKSEDYCVKFAVKQVLLPDAVKTIQNENQVTFGKVKMRPD